jgi:hypothetical protein
VSRRDGGGAARRVTYARPDAATQYGVLSGRELRRAKYDGRAQRCAGCLHGVQHAARGPAELLTPDLSLKRCAELSARRREEANGGADRRELAVIKERAGHVAEAQEAPLRRHMAQQLNSRAWY